MNSMKLIKSNYDQKTQIKKKNKYLSPNTKNLHYDKAHIKDEQAKLRHYVKSLQLKKQQLDEYQSPTKRLNRKKLNKNNKISVISLKKIDSASRPTLRKNQTILDNNTSQTYYSANIYNQKMNQGMRETKKNKKEQNKFQYQNIVNHAIQKNNTLYYFNDNQKQRQNTASFNQELNDSLCNQQCESKIEFSPSARKCQKYPILKLKKTSSNTNKLNQQTSRSPVNRHTSNAVLLQHNKTSPVVRQEENKNKNIANLQQLKQSVNDFKKLKQQQAKFTFRQASTQNHLTIASEDQNSKVLDNTVNPFEKITSSDSEYKKQQRKITNKEMPKTLVDCRNQLGMVKQSVISQISDENKDIQHSFYYGTNNKVTNNKSPYKNIFNPQYENNISTSYSPSYNLSLISQSYKHSPSRYLIKNLNSATVNSILQPIRDSEIRQKVQQSVVMHDFFNRPPQYQQIQ